MNRRILTNRDEMILRVTVKTLSPGPQKIRVIVNDAEQVNTVFTNRYNIFEGEKAFLVRMPLSPKVAEVQVFNEAIGNFPEKQETSFELVGPGIERLPLVKKMDVVDMGNPDVYDFVRFAQQFCYNAGVMDTGMYQNRKRNLKINYMPSIFQRDGKESATPARINEKTKIIDVSQRIFLPFTVPMRFAILCHEFAHCYLNMDKYSETEADLQGLLIYLGLGYPRIEAYQAFLETFIGTPSEQNKKRYNTVNRFITDFENHKMLMNE